MHDALDLGRQPFQLVQDPGRTPSRRPGVRMPVDSMSMRALIGMVQALLTPGKLQRVVHLGMSVSIVMPGRPFALAASD